MSGYFCLRINLHVCLSVHPSVNMQNRDTECHCKMRQYNCCRLPHHESHTCLIMTPGGRALPGRGVMVLAGGGAAAARRLLLRMCVVRSLSLLVNLFFDLHLFSFNCFVAYKAARENRLARTNKKIQKECEIDRKWKREQECERQNVRNMERKRE